MPVFLTRHDIELNEFDDYTKTYYLYRLNIIKEILIYRYTEVS